MGALKKQSTNMKAGVWTIQKGRLESCQRPCHKRPVKQGNNLELPPWHSKVIKGIK